MKTNKILKSAVSCARAWVIPGLAIVLAFFASCSNLQTNKTSEKTQKLYTVTGSISSSCALPSSVLEEMQAASRSASISKTLLESEGKIKVYAQYERDNPDDNPGGELFYGEATNDDDGNLTYQIGLPKGKWWLYIEKTIGDGLLTASKEIEIEDANKDGQDIVLRPAPSYDYDSDDADGKVNLLFHDKTYNGERGRLASVQLKCLNFTPYPEIEGEEPDSLNPLEAGCELLFERDVATLSLADIRQYNYLMELSFNDADGNTLYRCEEFIQVYNGFTTDAWFGNSAHLNEGAFEVTEALIDNYGTEPVPSTKTTVYEYNYDSANYEESYRIYSKSGDENPVQIMKLELEDYSEYDFDANGYIYGLTKNSEAVEGGAISNVIAVISEAGSDDTSIEYDSNNTYLLAIDRVKNDLWIFRSYYDLDEDATINKFFKYENFTSISDFTVSSTFTEYKFSSDGIPGTYYPQAFTVNDGIMYIAGRSYDSGTETYKNILCFGDPDAGDIGQGRFKLDNSIDLATSEEEIPSTEDNPYGVDISPDNIKATDIIYQDGAVYVLLNEDSSPSNSAHSRGALVKMDLYSGKKYIGWNNDRKRINEPIKAWACYSSSSQLFTDNKGEHPLVAIFDVPSLVEERYSLYAPYLTSNSDGTQNNDDLKNYFAGPRKFVAIKPKKLVILDCGIAFYTDSDGIFSYKKVNRIVEVDLETLSMSPSDDLEMNLEKTYPYPGSFASGYEKMVDSTTMAGYYRLASGNYVSEFYNNIIKPKFKNY